MKTSGIHKITICALFCALIIIGTFIKIPIPPVPVTLQTLFVILAGLVAGAKLGTVSVVVYALLGLAGLPIFSGGSGGIGYIVTPTFGYIIGFVIAAYSAGKISAGVVLYKKCLLASFVAMGIIYVCGIVWYCLVQALYFKVTTDFAKLALSFFLLPLAKDVAICFMTAGLAVRLRKALNFT